MKASTDANQAANLRPMAAAEVPRFNWGAEARSGEVSTQDIYDMDQRSIDARQFLTENSG